MKALSLSCCILLSILLPAQGAVVSDFTSTLDPSGQGDIISWDATNATLLTSSSLAGPWVPVPEAASPYLAPADLAQQYFRLDFGPIGNATPTASSYSYTVAHDQPLSIVSPGVLVSDTSPNGMPLTAGLETPPANGTVTLSADGSFLYMPNPGFVGSDSFSYYASSDAGVSAPATVSITVINHAPVAVNDSYGVEENQVLFVEVPGVLVNDSDADGDAITPTLATGPANGTVALNSDGSFTYTPNSNYFGPDSFTYSDNDGLTNGNTATVSINVHAGNNAPTAMGQNYTIAQDTPLVVTPPGVLGGAADADGDALTALLVSGPTNGTLTLNSDGSFQYQPGAGFVGFDGFTFEAFDGQTNSAPATVAITVTNSTPLSADYTYYVNSGGTLNVAASGVLLDDIDPNGDLLQAQLVSGPNHGGLTLNSDGSFTYTNTDLSFQGADIFLYQAVDLSATSTSAVATVSIMITNLPPVGVAQSYGVHMNLALNMAAPGVLAGAYDPEGNPMTAQAATLPTNGTLTVNSDGSFIYTPNNGYTGPDGFTFTVNDPFTNSVPALVSLNVHATNAPPMPAPTEYTIRPDETLYATNTGDESVLNTDVDNDGDPMTAALMTPPGNGSITFSNNGTFIYTPNQGFVGLDTFTYQPFDGLVAGAVTPVTINVENVPPVGTADVYSIQFNGTLTVGAPGVLENDSDADDDEMTADLVSSPSNGSLEFNTDGSFVYTPNTNFVGTDTFTYMADDGYATSPATTVTINVTDTQPVAQGAIYSVITNGTLSVSAPGLTENAYDDDGDPLTLALVTGTTNGALSLNPDGSFNYAPNPGFIGTDSFTYTASDGALTSTPNTVTIEVTSDGNPNVVPHPDLIDQTTTLQMLTFDNVGQTPRLGLGAGVTPTGRAVYSDWFGLQRPERGLNPVIQLEPNYWNYSWRWQAFGGVIGPISAAVPANPALGNPGRQQQFGYPYIYVQGNKLAAKARILFSGRPAGYTINLTGDVYWGATASAASTFYSAAPGAVFLPVLTPLRDATLTATTPLRANGLARCSQETAFMLASSAFPKTVGFLPMTIVWHYNIQGALIPAEYVCGISRHTIYLTFGQSQNVRNYWTVVDDGCRAANNAAIPAGNGNQAAFINSIWTSEFSGGKATRVDNAPLGYYSTVLQTANSPLGWIAQPGGWQAPALDNLPGMLTRGSGFNNAWAELFLEVLQAQGLKNAAGGPVGSLRRALPTAPEGALLKGTLTPLAGAGPRNVFSTPYSLGPGLIFPSFGKGPAGMPVVPGNPWRVKVLQGSPLVPAPSSLMGQNGNTPVPKPNPPGAMAAAQASGGPPNWMYLSYLVNAGNTYYDPAYGLSYSGISDMQTKWLGGTGAAATGGAFRWIGWRAGSPTFTVRKIGAGAAGFLSFVSINFTTQPANAATGANQTVVVTATRRTLAANGAENDANLQGVNIQVVLSSPASAPSTLPMTAMTGANGQASFTFKVNRANNAYSLVARVILPEPAALSLKPSDFAPAASTLFNVGP